MKLPVRILLMLLCAALIAALPFTVSSPNMLNDIKMELMNDEGDEEDIDFGRLLFSTARAEEADESEAAETDELEVKELKEGGFSSHPEWKLPLDFTPGQVPNPELYTANGYEDETIRVRMEHQEMEDGTKMHVAYVQIADPSQIRTAVGNPEKLGSTRGKAVSTIAKASNAVIAINGDNYTDEPRKTTFEYRMTNKIRSKGNKQKDILIIDDQGDFHLFVQSKGIKEFPEQLKKEGRILVNAFTFGPALVKDGEVLELNKNYGYNPGGREPRAAIGQTGPLSYVMVIIEAKGRDGKSGFSQEKLAEFMYGLGCVQAFNLDSGNSAEMVFGDQIIKGMPGGDERTLSDIIYFATAQQ